MPVTYWVFAVASICGAIVVPTFFLIRQLDRTERHLPSVTPNRFGLTYSDIRIGTPAGELTAWYISAQKERAPAIVMLHGWGGNSASLLPFAQMFHENGFNALLPNASGHGDSDVLGRADMLRFLTDFELSLDWLKTRDDIDEVLIMGHSIAGAAALLLGTRRHDLAGVITFGVFAHSRQFLRQWIKQRTRFPFWPFGWLALLFKQLQLGISYDRIAPENTIAAQSAPVLMIHGVKDTIVPVRDARVVATNGGARVTLIEDKNGGHATFLQTSKRLKGQLQDFIDTVSHPHT
jgi:uncharacterized protein